MSVYRTFFIFATIIGLAVFCSSPDIVIKKHKIICADIIKSGWLIYDTGADTLLSQDQYSEMIHDLSQVNEILKLWEEELRK